MNRLSGFWRRVLCALALAGGIAALSQTVTRLADVRKIYVDKMDRNLDEALRSEIARQFPKPISVVDSVSQADAILTEVKIDPEDVHTITVNLTDAGRIAVLWSGTASDRDLKFGGLKKSGTNQVARHLVKELKKAMHR